MQTLDSSSSGSSDEDEDRTHRSTRKQPRNQHTSNYGSSSRLHVHQLPASASLPLTNGRRRPSDSRRSSNSSSSSGDDDEEEEGQDDEGANSSEQCLLIEHKQQSLQPCRLTASSPLSAFFGGSYQASAAAAVTAAAAAAAVAVSSGPSGKMLLDVPRPALIRATASGRTAPYPTLATAGLPWPPRLTSLSGKRKKIDKYLIKNVILGLMSLSRTRTRVVIRSKDGFPSCARHRLA